MTYGERFVHYVIHLPYVERLWITFGISFAIALLFCFLMDAAVRNKQSYWLGASIIGALVYLFGCMIGTTGLLNEMLTLGAVLGYLVVGILLLRRYSIAQHKPKNGPWG